MCHFFGGLQNPIFPAGDDKPPFLVQASGCPLGIPVITDGQSEKRDSVLSAEPAQSQEDRIGGPPVEHTIHALLPDFSVGNTSTEMFALTSKTIAPVSVIPVPATCARTPSIARPTVKKPKTRTFCPILPSRRDLAGAP